MKGKKGQRSVFSRKLLLLFSFVLMIMGGLWSVETVSAALPNPLETKADLTQPLLPDLGKVQTPGIQQFDLLAPSTRAASSYVTYNYNAVAIVSEDYNRPGRPDTTDTYFWYQKNKEPIVPSTKERIPVAPKTLYEAALQKFPSGPAATQYAKGTVGAYLVKPTEGFVMAFQTREGYSQVMYYTRDEILSGKPLFESYEIRGTWEIWYYYRGILRLKADPVQQVFPVGQTQPTSFDDWLRNIRWLEDDGKTWTPVTSGYTISLKTTWDSSKAGNFTYQVNLTYKGATAYIDVPVQFVNAPSSTITFNFVDENGNQIRSPETKTGIQGANWSLPAPAIDGYTFDRSSSGAQSGAFGATNQTITYYYKKDQPAKEPLKVVFTKYNADKTEKLQGAQMEFQSLKSNGTWQKFNVANDTTNYTTNQYGEIVLSQAVIDAIEIYGGTSNDQKFRFVEKKAPDGYVQPNGSSNPGAAFTSEEKVLTKDTEGQQNFTLTNTKEAPKPVPGNITVYYWRDGTEVTSSRRTINTSSYAVGDQVEIPSPSGDWSDYTFNRAVINDTNHTVNTWPVKVTLTTAEQHVWVYYDKKPAQTYGDVTVNYYITGTKTKIQDSILLLGNAATKPVPTPPSSLSYGGKTYTLNPMAELNGLSLPAGMVTAVTMTADDQELNFYYDPPVEPKPASISVYYYIEDTKTPVHDMYSWVPTNAIGSQVQAPASQEYTYQGDTYELVSYKLNTTGGAPTTTSNPISVTVSATQQSVYYYYRKKEAPPTPGQPVTVNYYIENTKTALQNSTTITGNVGDNKPVPTPPDTLTKDGITYELTSAELDGTEVALPFGTVLITNQQRTLNFYYKATITPGGTVTVYYYQGQGDDTDKYTYVNGSKKELKANVGDVLDVTSSSVGDFTGYKFKVAYINLNSPATNVTSPPVNVTVTDKAQTVWVYYEKEAPTYYLKQVKVPTQTYSAGIKALDQGQWQELFGNGNMIAVMQTGNANPVAYLDQTTYTFMPTLDTAQTPWNSTIGTDRPFKVTITPTPNLLGKYPGLQPIVADAKLTFIDTAYTLQLMIRNQDGETVSFAPTVNQPFMMQDISEGLGVNVWPYEGTVNATDRTIVGFPGFSFVAGTQYRVKQTATPGEDYPTLWNNGDMTKTFALTKDNKLTVFQGSGGGTPGDYAVANKEVKIDNTWSAKYDTNAKVLTLYFVNEEVPPGELTWTVPDDMDFGEVKTPVRQAQDIFLQAQQEQKNWQIAVSDTRQKNRNQWDITAQLTTPLINTVNQKQLAKNILKFKSTANGTAQDLSQATQIYQSAANPALGDTPITWNSTSGFYLDLISNGYYPVGQYVGNVTFTLNTTP